MNTHGLVLVPNFSSYLLPLTSLASCSFNQAILEHDGNQWLTDLVYHDSSAITSQSQTFRLWV
jgi:hypothetical protein